MIVKNLRKKLCKANEKLTTTLGRSLRKCKICGKWCHSGNPLSEAVIGRILGAKNNWQPEWRFPKHAFKKWLTIFLRKC